MSFLNPLVLFGLAAASIPLLLHLLNLRKLRTVEFSTLRFIKELQRTQIRTLKLQQILLLILRTLIIVFAVFAFSRPVIDSALPVLGSHVKTSVVIVFDNSFSMDYNDERGNRLKQAKQAAEQIIGALKDGDEAAVLTSADVRDDRKISFSSNYTALAEEVRNIPLAYTSAELHQLLRMASSLLGNSMNINREVYVISDAQKNVLANRIDTVRLTLPSTTVFGVHIGGGSTMQEQNLSVDSVAVTTKMFQQSKPVEVEALIRNTSGRDAQGVVVGMSFNGSRVAQRSIDIPAGQTRTAFLSAPPDRDGSIRASVEIEGDAIEADNKRYFGFIIPPKPNVLLVGDAGETQFAVMLLQSEAGANVATLRTIPTQQFGAVNIADYDVVVLAGSPPQSEIPRLTQYVTNGGGVFVFANESDVSAQRQIIAPLKIGALTEAGFVPSQPAQFTSTDKQHPLFAGVFKGTNDQRAVVESPRMTKALPCNGAQPVIQMQGGSFLAESRVGEGKVLYCAVPPTAAWSNFPVTGIFPVILFRSIVYLSSREQTANEYAVGEPVMLTLPKRTATGGTFTVTDPTGSQSYRQALALSSGIALDFGVLRQPGVYAVAKQSGEPVAAIAVNIPRSESSLESWSGTEWKQQLENVLAPKTPLAVIDNTGTIGASVARARTGTELWKLFVILAIACAIAEMVVARYTPNPAAAAA